MAHHKKEEHHKKHREGHEGYKRGGRAHTGVNHGGSQNRDDLHKAEIAYGNEDVVKEAKSTKNAFKHGGKVDGKKAKHHMGKHKFARGGRAKHGSSPFSSAFVHGIKGDAK